VPPYLDALIGRVTARDPDVRPPDAKVMLTLVRRVRAALREGAVDDVELTQDLTIPDGSLRIDPTLSEPAPDRADYEVTELVQPAAAPTVTRAAGAHAVPLARTDSGSDDRASGRENSWPTVLDAPPPAVRRPRRRPVSSDEDRRRVSRNRRRGWLALLIVLMLTTLAALAGWYYTEGRFTTAPAITAMTATDAENAAQRAGLDVVFESAYSESVAKGTVVSASPTPGAKIVKGEQIQAVVSRGPERFAMPRVLGLTRSAAVTALTAARLAPGRVTTDYSPTVAKGQVLRASKEAGASLKRQTVVDLVVSAGPRPIRIESFDNKPAADATSALKKAGFTVKVTKAHSATVPAGTVISQRPDSGTGFAGDTITLKRSLGPVMVAVPQVKGKGTRVAARELKAQGFKVKVRPVLIGFLGLGSVSYTRPAIGTKVPKGSTITLYTY
jgi:beta-lactam-binding protein with PASTA domain